MSKPSLHRKEISQSISSDLDSYNDNNIANMTDEKVIKPSISHPSREEFYRNRVASLRDKLNVKGQPVVLLTYLENAQFSDALALAKNGSSRVRLDVCLLWAALTGNSDFSKLLLDHGAQAEARDAEGFSVLHLAANSGSVSIIEAILRENVRTCGPNSFDSRGEYTPLMLAALYGFSNIINILLSHGADINAGLQTRGVTALHCAVFSGNLDCVQLLIEKKAAVNVAIASSEAPLHLAVEEGHSDIVESLIKANADVNATRGHFKNAGLHIAAQADDIFISQQLLEAGADSNQQNSKGKSPLHLAARCQCSDTVEVLLNYKADPNAQDVDGRTPLHAGIFKGYRNFECLKLLVEMGADPNIPDNSGYTPLHLAALNDSTYCVKLLLKHGGDLTKTTKGGVTALNIMMRRTPSAITQIQDNLNSAICYVEHDQQFERDGQVGIFYKLE